MKIKRIDPLNDYIRSAYSRCVSDACSFEKAEIELERYKASPLDRAGIGYYLIDLSPNKVRGYLAAYDALNALGYDVDSEVVLKDYLFKIGFHILAAVRLINRYIDKSFFDDAIDIISLAKNEIFNYFEKDRSLKLKVASMYKTMCLVEEYEEVSGDTDFFRQSDYANLHAKLVASSFEEQVGLIQNLINNEQPLAASLGFWIAVNSGNKTQEFFSMAVKNLVTENDTAVRLIYFRIRAREEFPNNYNFVDLAIQSLLHRSEIGRVEGIISELISRDKFDSCILNHAIRVSALTGFLDGQIISNNAWKGFLQEKFYLLQRQFSISKWQQDFEKSHRMESTSVSSGSFKFNNFVSDTFSSKHKTDIRVALLVSGQLRGSERQMRENISGLARELGADVFMDVWDEQVLSPPRFNRVARFLGVELFSRLPEEAKIPVGFQRLLPSVFKKLTTPIRKSVDAGVLMENYSALSARVEDQAIFEDFCKDYCPGLKFRNTFNQAKMFYKIFQANECLESYEKKAGMAYDVIFRSRPDLKLVLPNLNEVVNAVYQNKNLIYVGYVNNVGFCDQFAIGSRAAMRSYSEIWRRISEANSFKYSPIMDKWSLHAAEPLLACHLTLAGLDVRVIKPVFHDLVTPLIINEVDISEELINDVSQSSGMDFSNFSDYYFSKKNNNYLFR